jgi:hypothetical protein
LYQDYWGLLSISFRVNGSAFFLHLLEKFHPTHDFLAAMSSLVAILAALSGTPLFAVIGALALLHLG